MSSAFVSSAGRGDDHAVGATAATVISLAPVSVAAAHDDAAPPSPPPSSPRVASRYVLGIALLLCVVVLWQASSMLIHSIFHDLDFHHAFFLTYYSTSLFSLYLVPVAARRCWLTWTTTSVDDVDGGAHFEDGDNEGGGPGGDRRKRRRQRRGRAAGYAPVSVDDDDARFDRDTDDAESPTATVASPSSTATTKLPPLTTRETASIAIKLLPCFFLMNYFFNASLQLTSVASSTVLGSSSSLFVMMWSHLLRPRSSSRTNGDGVCSVWNFIGIVFTVTGTVIISVGDTRAQQRRERHRAQHRHVLHDHGGVSGAALSSSVSSSPFVSSSSFTALSSSLSSSPAVSSILPSSADAPSSASPSPSMPMLGDALCLLSAAFYGLYTVLVEHLIDDARVDMLFLFGLIGACNTLLLWPCFFVLDVVGVESFVVPSLTVLSALLLNGLFGSVVSDFLWTKSILLTSPLVASLGLSLGIPLSIFIEVTWYGRPLTFGYAVGVMCVFVGFLLVEYLARHGSNGDDDDHDDGNGQANGAFVDGGGSKRDDDRRRLVDDVDGRSASDGDGGGAFVDDADDVFVIDDEDERV